SGPLPADVHVAELAGTAGRRPELDGIPSERGRTVAAIPIDSTADTYFNQLLPHTLRRARTLEQIPPVTPLDLGDRTPKGSAIASPFGLVASRRPVACDIYLKS